MILEEQETGTILDFVKNWGTEGEVRRNLTFHFMRFSTV